MRSSTNFSVNWTLNLVVTVAALLVGSGAFAVPAYQNCAPLEVNQGSGLGVNFRLHCEIGTWKLLYTGAIPSGYDAATLPYRLELSGADGPVKVFQRTTQLATPAQVAQVLAYEVVKLDNQDLAMRECAEVNCTKFKRLNLTETLEPVDIVETEEPSQRYRTFESADLGVPNTKRDKLQNTQAQLEMELYKRLAKSAQESERKSTVELIRLKASLAVNENTQQSQKVTAAAEALRLSTLVDKQASVLRQSQSDTATALLESAKFEELRRALTAAKASESGCKAAAVIDQAALTSAQQSLAVASALASKEASYQARAQSDGKVQEDIRRIALDKASSDLVQANLDLLRARQQNQNLEKSLKEGQAEISRVSLEHQQSLARHAVVALELTKNTALGEKTITQLQNVGIRTAKQDVRIVELTTALAKTEADQLVAFEQRKGLSSTILELNVALSAQEREMQRCKSRL